MPMTATDAIQSHTRSTSFFVMNFEPKLRMFINSSSVLVLQFVNVSMPDAEAIVRTEKSGRRCDIAGFCPLLVSQAIQPP